jgi:hypothetical protein
MDKQKETTDIRIYNVCSKVSNDLTNIAKHHRVERSAFLKMELRKIRDSYPEYMRIEPKNHDC